MILILSTNGDLSTDQVINWLIHYNCAFIRINDNDILTGEFSFSFTKEDTYLRICEKNINLNAIKVVWYRKFGFFRFSNIYKHFSDINSEDNYLKLTHLREEYHTIRELLLSLLKDKIWLANPAAANINKVDVLIKASKANLKMPYTLITNSVKTAADSLKNGTKVITKALSQGTMFRSESNKQYTTLTARFDEDDVKNISERFFPSLIQEEIEKEYEIRSFYLMGKFYSMAIFSQSNEKTEVDLRNYDLARPNRTVPYSLPKDIETKIDILMKDLDLNTGSIDLIRSSNGEYFFLEVNPGGQFGMVEDTCNYNLHEEIAVTLIKLRANE